MLSAESQKMVLLVSVSVFLSLLANELMNHGTNLNETHRKWSLDIPPQLIAFWTQLQQTDLKNTTMAITQTQSVWPLLSSNWFAVFAEDRLLSRGVSGDLLNTLFGFPQPTQLAAPQDALRALCRCSSSLRFDIFVLKLFFSLFKKNFSNFVSFISGRVWVCVHVIPANVGTIFGLTPTCRDQLVLMGT